MLHTYGGKTIEVLDTDAEGRLVLSDGLTRAQEDKPDVLIDIATLTGAAVDRAGVAHRPASWPTTTTCARPSHDASKRAGEPMWPMPQPEELRANLDSIVADITNIPLAGRREGGMLTASVFLREFVADSQRWAHLDIAGPAYNGSGAVRLHAQGRHGRRGPHPGAGRRGPRRRRALSPSDRTDAPPGSRPGGGVGVGDAQRQEGPVTTQRRFLVLHGYTNRRPEGHWQRRLTVALRDAGEQVVYPALPDPDAPRLDVLARGARHRARPARRARSSSSGS